MEKVKGADGSRALPYLCAASALAAPSSREEPLRETWEKKENALFYYCYFYS